MIKIVTERLIIRHFTLDDTQKIYELSNEDTLVNWLPDQVYADLIEAKKTLKFLIGKYADNTYPLVMALEEKETGDLVGHVGLSEIAEGVEIGYAIGKAHQGGGYAKEAVKAYSDWAINNMDIAKLYGMVAKDNIASQKVLQFCGFAHYPDEDAKRTDDKLTYIK